MRTQTETRLVEESSREVHIERWGHDIRRFTSPKYELYRELNFSGKNERLISNFFIFLGHRQMNNYIYAYKDLIQNTLCEIGLILYSRLWRRVRLFREVLITGFYLTFSGNRMTMISVNGSHSIFLNIIWYESQNLGSVWTLGQLNALPSNVSLTCNTSWFVALCRSSHCHTGLHSRGRVACSPASSSCFLSFPTGDATR